MAACVENRFEEADDTQNVSELLKTKSLDILLEEEMLAIQRAEEGLCWYHERISRETAGKLLKEAATQIDIKSENEVVFLVRDRESGKDFSLSMMVAGSIFHVVIEEEEQGFFHFKGCPTIQGLECLIQESRDGLSWENLHANLVSFPKGTPPPSATRKTGLMTLLHRAVKEGVADVVGQMLEHSYCPDVNGKDAKGSTALHLAAAHGYVDIVKMLLTADAFINLKDIDGRTALHLACMGNHAATVRILLEKGYCDPDVRSSVTGWTPMHEAAKAGNVDCVKILLELNADANIKANDSETPRDVAKRFGQEGVLKELEKVSTSVMEETNSELPRQTRCAIQKEEWTVNRGVAQHQWLHSHLDDKGAEKLFEQHGMLSGLFLVRELEGGSYVLSVCSEGQVRHSPIEARMHKSRVLYHLEFGPMFSSLDGLVKHFSTFTTSVMALRMSIDTNCCLVKMSEHYDIVPLPSENVQSAKVAGRKKPVPLPTFPPPQTTKPPKPPKPKLAPRTSPARQPQQQPSPRPTQRPSPPQPALRTSSPLPSQSPSQPQPSSRPTQRPPSPPHPALRTSPSPLQQQPSSPPPLQPPQTYSDDWDDDLGDVFDDDDDDDNRQEGSSDVNRRPHYENLDVPVSTSGMFESEPLYQWYAADEIMRISGSCSDSKFEADEDATYENMERFLQRVDSDGAGSDVIVSENTVHLRRTVIREVFNQFGTLQRAMWCEMPEVVNSGVLDIMSDQEKTAQEAMFEIITSEASYQKSLNVLDSVYIKSAELLPDGNKCCVLTQEDAQNLFSNILQIRNISAEFLADLEARWQESHVMVDICDVITKHAQNNFAPYIQYCGNQAFQHQTFKRLLKRPEFSQAVKRLEKHRDCQCLPLSSFLMLPMQRITRLPLLVDAIQHRVEPNSTQHASAKQAFTCLQTLVKNCNEEARRVEQRQQMAKLRTKMKFGETKEFPLVTESRYLEKEGELKRIISDSAMRFPFARDKPNSRKEPVHIFLFTDIVVVTKKRGEMYIVQDYCPHKELETQIITSKQASWLSSVYSFLLTLNSNHRGQRVEYLLCADTESERTRWMDALAAPLAGSQRVKDYEDWDCPQVVCMEKYMAQQPDELTLEQADVISVRRKMADGWYYGERMRDCVFGWFPASCTLEIENAHVRLRNLRLQARLMEATQKSAHK